MVSVSAPECGATYACEWYGETAWYVPCYVVPLDSTGDVAEDDESVAEFPVGLDVGAVAGE